ncbi:hypothetical protein [Amycolatopsis sp.]|jgi:hypothetical protein|uniref:hypothetical protein n=1 Tax=Amycolatopsis sp. TaxID=37632 RepID=UPI002E069B28|nr:hypothetical protein [Amycolatopsis sp.]
MMVRTAVRSTTARPSPRVGTAVELLDRTGIIAASLPQRRRTEFETDVEPPAAAMVAEPGVAEPQPKDMDLRPRSVVIHRRAKAWVGAAAGVTLLAIGWLAGGTLANQDSSETALPVDVRQNVAEQPAVPPPAAPPVTPATEVIEVPAKVPAAAQSQHKAVPSTKAQRPVVRSSPEPRVDLPEQTPKTQPTKDIGKQVGDFVKPFFEMMSGR